MSNNPDNQDPMHPSPAERAWPVLDTLLRDLENVDGELSIRRFRGAWRVRLTPVNHGAFRTSDAEDAELNDALSAVLQQSSVAS